MRIGGLPLNLNSWGDIMKGRLDKILPYLLISPYLIIYVVFILVPLVWVLFLSFTNYSAMNPGEWVGLENYRRMLADNTFFFALRNTGLYWIFTVIPGMAIGLIVANFLSLKLKATPLFRGLIYLPGVMSGVGVAMTWLWLYDPRNGPINKVLEILGITGRDWLSDPAFALPAIIIVGIWIGIGFSMIIYLAGLQGIPEQLYEAASIDGASNLRQFFIIKIPLLKPITFFLFIINTITSFQVFDIVYIMTNGGPANRTTTIVNEIVKRGFEDFAMGYASALAICLLVITLLFTVVNYWFNSKESDLS